MTWTFETNEKFQFRSRNFYGAFTVERSCLDLPSVVGASSINIAV